MNSAVRQICWLNGGFRVPADWEITAYSVEEREGRLEFGNRRGFQALFSWNPCKTRPDRTALLSAFPVPPGGEGRKSHKGEFRTAEVGHFVLAWGRADGPCQAMGFWEAERKRIRWIFPTAGEAQLNGVIKPILESAEPNSGPLRRFCAFGLDFRLPAEFRLERVNAQPANVEMVFESSRKVRVSFHRLGLPEALLQGQSLEAFYSTFLRARGASVHLVRPTVVGEWEAVDAAFSQAGEHQLDRFMGRDWTNGEGRLWYDRGQKRLLAFEQIGPPKVSLLSFESIFKRDSP